MKKIKILISCNKETEYINNNILQPIQLGCSLKKEYFDDMLHDDNGDNISELNNMYCEMTAQYWAWKNLDLDYYGFCHYRRYFNFSNKYYEEDSFGNIIDKYIDKNTVYKYGLDENTIRNIVENNDIVITERKDLRTIGVGYKNVLYQYKGNNFLHSKDLQTIYTIIKELYPEFERYASLYLNGYESSFCNMYILKKEIFLGYCEWVFSILAEFCKRTDMSKYSTEALRTPGHLAERLFGIYYLYLIDKNPNLKIKELQCVLFEHTEKSLSLKPYFNKNSIPVVFAANNYYVPIFAACMQSVIDCSNDNFNYDIVLLHTDITHDNQNKLLNLVKNKQNFSLRFFNVGKIVSNYNLKANAHISVETYYRFLIQDILPDYNKILYLDCDIIVNSDISELYNINIDDYMLAAAQDPDFLGQINGANPDTMRYCCEKFHMKNPYNYFQAGVLLFNNIKMKKSHTLHEWLTYASHPYLYNDQDVLNLYCEGKVKYIDMSWNMITDCNHTRISKVIVYAPDNIQKQYKNARLNPKIIHYAGFMKPWNNPSEDYAHYFWMYLRKTEFYEYVLYRISKEIVRQEIAQQRMEQQKIEQQINSRSKLRKIIDKILPKGTARRETVKKFFGKNISSRI